MIGITSLGTYIPFCRLDREEISRAWGTPVAKGQKSVAHYDEDTITMGVAAAFECLKDQDIRGVEGLFFATTNSPYKEKQSASIAAGVLGFPKNMLTVDIANSIRGGTIAFHLALDAINSGRMKNVLVITSDCRLGAPKGSFESQLGDGAAALLLGNSHVIATIEDSYSITNDILDVWRSDKDTYLRSWEDRFVITQGYMKNVSEAVQGLFGKCGLAPKDFDKIIMYAPDIKNHVALAKTLGFKPNTQLQDSLISQIGNTGTSSTLMMLAAALKTAKAGDRLLLVSYGDGCDAISLKVTEEIGRLKNHRGIDKYLKSESGTINYEKYLRWKAHIDVEPPRLLDPLVPAPSALYREYGWVYSLKGQKCRECGNVQFPPKRICQQCHAKDAFEEYGFADKKASIFSFAKDYATGRIELPRIICVIDFEGGGRIQTELIDYHPGEVRIGLRVEMTFRKLQSVNGIHHYYWKCKPVK